MTFFEPLPPLPDSEPQPTGWRPPAWDRPSEAILGALVPMSRLLARNDRIAVALGEVMAFPNGFSFSIVIQSNPMTPRPVDRPGMFGMGGPMMHRGPRIGFEFADGGRASGAGYVPMGGETAVLAMRKDDQGIPTVPILSAQGGGGGGHHSTMRYWCFPLPPSGPMDLYLEWGDVGIAETKVTLDADAIRGAAPNAVVLWETDA